MVKYANIGKYANMGKYANIGEYGENMPIWKICQYGNNMPIWENMGTICQYGKIWEQYANIVKYVNVQWVNWDFLRVVDIRLWNCGK